MASNTPVYIYRVNNTRFQVVQAELRGDSFYSGKEKGFYHHDLDEDGAVIVPSITGPFDSPSKALNSAYASSGWTTMKLEVPTVQIPGPEHLGDGLYVGFDGEDIVFSVNHHNNHKAFMSASALRNFLSWLSRYPEFEAKMRGI